MAEEIKHEVTINASISPVFQAVADFEHANTWQPDVVNVGLTAAKPLRTGSMVSMTKKFMGSETFINADVTDYKPNKRIELKGIHGRFRFQREIEFTPMGGSTKIDDRFEVSMGWFWFWYKPFFMRALQNQTADEWQNLKNQLES
jgi:uncharacterized protein YndB with AHSA1/START domain